MEWIDILFSWCLHSVSSVVALQVSHLHIFCLAGLDKLDSSIIVPGIGLSSSLSSSVLSMSISSDELEYVLLNRTARDGSMFSPWSRVKRLPIPAKDGGSLTILKFPTMPWSISMVLGDDMTL